MTGVVLGLQIRWQLPEGGCGGFDSLTPPPFHFAIPPPRLASLEENA
jgi:hypothetical protein